MKRSQLTACLLWMVLVVTPAFAQANAIDTRKLYDESYKVFREGDYAEAIKGFDKCIKANPGFVKAFVFRGASYFLLDQHQKAIGDLDKALQLDPENPEALYYRGCAYLFKGDSKEAIKDYDRFLKIQTESGAGYFYRGLAHYRLNQLDLCVSDTSKAISFGLAKRSVVYALRGMAYVRMERNQAALDDFEAAANLEPDNTMLILLNYVAKARLGTQDKTYLQSYAQRATEKESWPYPVVQMYLGQIGPDECLKAAVNLSDERYREMMQHQADFFVGQYFIMNGQTDKGKGYVTKALGENKNLFLMDAYVKNRLDVLK